MEAYLALKWPACPPGTPAWPGPGSSSWTGRGLESPGLHPHLPGPLRPGKLDGIPLLPVEFILLPPWSGLSIYEFSSWTRATVVPLMIVMATRPVCPLPPEQGVPELFLDPQDPFDATGWPGSARLSWKTCSWSWTGCSSSITGCPCPGC